MNGLMDLADAELDWNKFDPQRYLINVLRGFNGAVAGDNTFGKLTKLGLDIWQGWDNAKNISRHFKNLNQIKFIYNTTLSGSKFSSFSKWGSFLSNITKPLEHATTFSGKIAPWMAGIDILFSTYELGTNLAQGKLANATSNLGEILMSGAVIASATGVGAPVAAGLAVAGGVLWAGGKIAEHWDTVKKVVTQPVQTAKEVGNMVKDGVSKAVDKVKNGIGSAVDKVKSWFS